MGGSGYGGNSIRTAFENPGTQVSIWETWDSTIRGNRKEAP